MKKLGSLVLILAGSLVLTQFAGAPPVFAKESSRPPKNLKKVGDHWTPWDSPAAGPGDYIIQRGDTLWDLAGKWFSDPYLWPQIWEQNRYILDSHWIYPGDPLVVPGRPTVVPEGIPATEEEPEQPMREGQATPGTAAVEPIPLLPVADASDLYCSGYVTEEHERSPLWIAGHDSEKVAVGEGDVVYLNQGRDQNIHAGNEYAVIREVRPVIHPATGKEVGTLIRRLGRARVMLAHPTSATAMLEMSCEDIRDGDELVPWVERDGPELSSVPMFDRYDPTPSGGLVGTIIAVQDNIKSAGAGHLIHTDLGAAAGVEPGVVLTLFREQGEDLPRINLGQAVVLSVDGEFSTAKVMLSVRESEAGDLVEIER